MMMRPKVKISSAADLSEDTLEKQDPSVLVEALAALLPDLAWRKESDGAWFGSLDGEDTWYEFRIGAEPDYVWSIYTSRRTATRNLIPVICNGLRVLAFDRQANRLIQPELGNPA